MGAPFGLKGFVKVKPFSGEAGHFSRLDKVIIRQGEKEDVRVIAEVVLGKEANSSLLVRFAGIDSPEAAKVLGGAEIIVEREFAAPLKEGEYYIEDLKGLEVISPEGTPLGTIADVLEGGGGNLAELLLLSGKKCLVPFRGEFFGDADMEAGKITLLSPWVLE